MVTERTRWAKAISWSVMGSVTLFLGMDGSGFFGKSVRLEKFEDNSVRLNLSKRTSGAKRLPRKGQMLSPRYPQLKPSSVACFSARVNPCPSRKSGSLGDCG